MIRQRLGTRRFSNPNGQDCQPRSSHAALHRIEKVGKRRTNHLLILAGKLLRLQHHEFGEILFLQPVHFLVKGVHLA